MFRSISPALVAALVLAACGGSPKANPPASAQNPVAGDGMMGMKDGMMGMSGDTMMMGQMRAHMDSMRQMSPDRMAGMMAQHDAMMASMMDRMGADMRGMGMAGSAAWTALTDSIKRDLAELPALTGKAAETRLREHAARVERLLASHAGMMGSMRK